MTRTSVAARADATLLRLGSSYRERTASGTLVIAERLMPALGISRVTDITRMDRLGLPVFASVRPRGNILRVNAGKGLDPIDARVGALMEAVEYAAADPASSRWRSETPTVSGLVSQLPDDVQFVDFAPRVGVAISPDQRIEAVACEEIATGDEVLLPAELIFVPHRPRDAASVFGWTSNGLASGNSLAEATLHGLLEVLERDAVAMNRPRDASCRVDDEDLPEPFRALASEWRDAGIELAVRSVPNAFALPCFEAFVHEKDSRSVNLAIGCGLHLERDIALTRAVCEAAQSRLSHIHGGRDTITAFYSKYTDMSPSVRDAHEGRLLERIFDGHRRIRYDDVPHIPSGNDSIADVLADLLGRLATLGFPSVFRHLFDLPLDGLCVVKVVVPRCEQGDPHSRRVGPRLFARVTGDA